MLEACKGCVSEACKGCVSESAGEKLVIIILWRQEGVAVVSN